MTKSNLPIWTTVGVLLTVSLFLLSWKMFLPNYLDNKAQVNQLESEIVDAREYLESLENAESELSSMGDIKDLILIAVPTNPDDPDLISELESIALANNLLIPAIDIAQSSDQNQGGQTTSNSENGESQGSLSASGTQIMTISISVNGSFGDINKLIAALENDIRFMNITDISYSSDEESGLSVAFQIESFIQIPKVSDDLELDDEYLNE